VVLASLNDLPATFAARGPKTALIAFQGGSASATSYSELSERIARAGAVVAARGIAAGDRVALIAPNSVDWIAGYFGILAAGAIAMPIDHLATTEQVIAAFRVAPPRLVLTTRSRAAELAALPDIAPLLVLDENALAAETQNAAVPKPARASPSEFASILFTSGTTGTPKAVPLTHANLTANVRELLAAELIGGDDRVLLPLPLHHTYPFTVGLLTPLAAGATVILPAAVSGPEIAEAARTAGATALLAVPRLCTALWASVTAAVEARGKLATALFGLLLRVSIAVRRLTGRHIGRLLFGSVHERLGTSLTLIGCGGAKLPERLTTQLEGLGWHVLTGYGLTETSPVLTFNSRRHARIGSEGRALPGVEIRIGEEPAAGEIQAKGPSVFGGYLDNPTANATAFTDDGWFRTGDLGKIDRDGYLSVIGRSKELIVLADGKKLFPETVEARYAASPLLREIGIFERNGQLAAIVVPDEAAVRERGATREAQLLREEIEDIGGRLAPYERLSAFRIAREALPRTQLGKLKRHLLPGIFDALSRPGESRAAPKAAPHAFDGSPLERQVWAWLEARYPKHTLTRETSPQLDLEIDSLEWVTLTLEIERRFGVTLTGEAVSRILTLADLLDELGKAPAAQDRRGSAVQRFVPPGALSRALGAVLFAVVRPMARWLWRVDVQGLPKLPLDAPLVITPNHASYLDPLAIAAALPWRVLRKTYWAGWVGVLFNTPLRRLVSRIAQVFPIDPDHDLAGAVDAAREILQRGGCVVWFPEGRRSPTGALGEFRAGIGLLLEQAQVAAVPTAIRGSFEAWPKLRRWPRLSRIEVVFGEPRRLAGSSASAASRALEDDVRELLGPLPTNDDTARRDSPQEGQ